MIRKYIVLVLYICIIPLVCYDELPLHKFTALFFLMVFLLMLLVDVNDFRSPVVLFNSFYIVFLVFGVLANATIRTYNEITAEMVLVGYWFFNLAVIIFHNTKNKYSCLNVTTRKVNFQVKATISLILFLSLVSGVLYYFRVGHVPLLTATTPEQRIAALTGNGVYLQLLRFGIFSSIVAFFVGALNKRLCVLMFLCFQLMLLGTSFRGEFLQYFILFLLISSCLKGYNLSINKMLIFGCGLVVFSLFIGLLRGDEASSLSLYFKLLNMMSVGIYNLELVVSNFSEVYLGSTYFYGFTSVLGMQTEFTQWLSEQLPINFSGGVTPTVIGDSFINFGHYYFLVLFLLGAIVSLLTNSIYRSQGLDTISLIFVMNFSMWIARSTTGGISNVTLQLCLSSVLLYFLLINSRLKF